MPERRYPRDGGACCGNTDDRAPGEAKMKRPIGSVLVVVYGTMGKGIVLSFARAGFDTTVLSRDPSRIADLPEGARAVAELPAEAPDLVIESVPERIELKATLFERLERAYGDAPILASNTSGLPLDRMAAPLAHPANFLGIHYMHPAEALPLVEVLRVPQTTDAPSPQLGRA